MIPTNKNKIQTQISNNAKIKFYYFHQKIAWMPDDSQKLFFLAYKMKGSVQKLTFALKFMKNLL